jgi:hypothetical protein
LVLYDASNLLAPIELARDHVLSIGDSASGLVTFSFATAIPTAAGNNYFFAINALDGFGVGLRSLSSSTYAGGSEAWRNIGSGEITVISTGRDLSFEVTSVAVPEPKEWALMMIGIPLVLFHAKHRRALGT